MLVGKLVGTDFRVYLLPVVIATLNPVVLPVVAVSPILTVAKSVVASSRKLKSQSFPAPGAVSISAYIA